MSLPPSARIAMDAEQQVALLGAILASSDDAILSADLKGAVTSWNAGAERLMGWSAEEILGRDVTDAYPGDRLHEKAQIRDALRRGEPLEGLETVRLRKDGTPVDVVVTHTPIRAADGTMVGVLSIARDITDRKRAEETRSRLAAIVESSDDAILSKGLDGVVLTWNGGAERMFGYPADEIVGRPIDALMGPDRPDEGREIIAALLRGEKVDHLTTVRRTKDGTPIDVFVSASAIRDAAGEVVGVSTLVQDATRYMTEQRAQEAWTAKLEARVEARTAELRTAMAEMESCAYAAAHDLRAPVRPNDMTRRRVETDPECTFSDEAKRLLDRQGRAVARMLTLIDDLLGHSQLSRREIVPQALDLSDVARRAWDEVTQGAPPPGLSLEVEPGLEAWGDPTLVRFALQNLLQNAVKFSPDGGVVRVDREADGAFAVSDQGVGFEMRYAEGLFKAFHRLVREAEFPGTGIGLANVRRIVERHGGRVWAESAPGKGTTFRFTLAPPLPETVQATGRDAA